MKRIIITAIMVLASIVLTVPATYAIPTLHLWDRIGGSTITVADGSENDTNPTTGAVTYNGPVGSNWMINVSTGISLREDITAPEIHLSTVDSTLFGPGKLTIMFSDADFGPLPVGSSFTTSIGGLLARSGKMNNYATFLASNNGILEVGDATLLSELGPFDTAWFGGSDDSDAFLSMVDHPYSLTQLVTIEHTRPGISTSSLDATLTANVPSVQVPEPSTLLLLGAGLIGMVVFRRRIEN